MQGLQSFFFVALVVVAVVLAIVWRRGRCNSLLRQWADKNRYRITRQEYRLFKGPYFWTSAKGQAVYHVVLEDPDGNKRSGWVRCGSWWFGLLSDKVEVRWDHCCDVRIRLGHIREPSKALHLTGPASRFFETSRSLQPAPQVNAVVRPLEARQMGNAVKIRTLTAPPTPLSEFDPGAYLSELEFYETDSP